MNAKPRISVVVCSYNGGKKIRQCLDALMHQSLKKEDYEIIVVDDGSTDATGSILKQYDITVITNKENKGLAESRNIGVFAARAEIIAFTDDDCVPEKEWLNYIIKPFSDKKVVGVGGRIIPYKTNRWLLKYYEANNPLSHLPYSLSKSSGFIYRFGQYLDRSLSLNQLSNSETNLFMIVGANMSIRRSAFDRVKGFNKSFRFGGEEEDLWKRLRTMDPHCLYRYSPRAVVQHDYDSSFKDALRRNYSYGIGNARSFITHKDRIPTIYPFPILILSSASLTIFNNSFIFVTLILFVVLYPGWLKLSILGKKPYYVLYSAIQATLEFATTIGFLLGYLRIQRTN